MQVRFLLGPAGSGKTFRCLTEIREALLASPEGPPLVFLAPKQATFQLERQLLAQPALPGYTRLQILSFERLAEFVFEKLGQPLPKLLAEEGRVMVLRALLGQKRNELRLFRASARLPGFADQLSQLLRELQRYHLTPEKLESLAAKVDDTPESLVENAFKSGHGEFGVPPSGVSDARTPEGGTPNRSFPRGSKLDAKLRDLALLLRAYREWLRQYNLSDADGLLDLAAAALRSASSARRPSPSSFELAGLWLDGFAQMTPQERQLLAAVIQCADQATLAFCLEDEPVDNAPWHSPWSLVGETCLRCREELALWLDVSINLEVLRRTPEQGRFAASPQLQHLERYWSQPKSCEKLGTSEVQVVECTDPESEAVFAARAILRYVREAGGRFRDAAILLRSLDGYHDVIRRVFARYEIPFFLDRRESVAHHPLAELTRYALRTVLFDWRQDDWFGALKTGLVPASQDEIDRLENEALAHGWEGKFWRQPPALGSTGYQPVLSGDSPDGILKASATHSDARFPAATSPIPVGGSPTGAGESPAPPIFQTGSDGGSPGKLFERLWPRIIPPFAQLASSLATARHEPNGIQLTAALRQLWNELKVENRLDEWSSTDQAQGALRTPLPELHQTVWEQMNEWLRNLEMAFASEPLPLGDWLPIVESGLGNLSIGVIPPALDQVLVGTIDRSRNPDLQMALVLGVNEGVFPAPPVPPVLLNSSDRSALAAHGAALGPDHRQQIGLERYYGYIACTRARRHLVLTYAQRDMEERMLNPSPFIGQVRRLFPQLSLETFSAASISNWAEALHRSELVAPLLRLRTQSVELTDWTKRLVASVPSLQPVLAKWEQVDAARVVRPLAPELVEKIYGAELRTSVSALEDFASCPFKFFAARGLRAEERVEFQVDQREKGTFQHEVLQEFHRQVQAAGKRWRDLSGPEARQWIRQIGEELRPAFRDGLFLANPSRRFAAGLLIEGLEKLVETLVGWAPQYQFDPQAVEVSFGLTGSRLPAWRINLDAEHALVLRGRVDRVDVCRTGETGEALGVIIDYKSSARELDPVLLHYGLELQLLAYLGALTQSEGLEDELKISRLLPAGVFYVSLKSGGGSAGTRDDERVDREQARRAGYQHRGRFDGDRLSQFDQRGLPKGDQFKYWKKNDGTFRQLGNEALPGQEFQELLAQIKDYLKQFGRGIYAGQVEVAPYRWKQETACDLCAYRPVCRFDPWTQPYRVLRPPPKADKSADHKMRPHIRPRS